LESRWKRVENQNVSRIDGQLDGPKKLPKNNLLIEDADLCIDSQEIEESSWAIRFAIPDQSYL